MTRREIDELLGKARRSLAAAERLLADGDTDFAISHTNSGACQTPCCNSLQARVRCV
jgi:hypothetical protein